MDSVTLIQANPQDTVSLLALFWQSHIVVKIVIIGLIGASVWCWAIVFEKLALFAKTRRQATKFEKIFWSGTSLQELYNQTTQKNRTGDAIARIFAAAMTEWKRSSENKAKTTHAPLLQRLEKIMDVQLQRETAKLEKRLPFLATIGATAPFIGLFGTVWGIMNAFRAIAGSDSTSLAVVAPGIAEALFATALGLLAAIPAVIFYNKFANDVVRLTNRFENFADEFATIMSRQLEEHIE